MSQIEDNTEQANETGFASLGKPRKLIRTDDFELAEEQEIDPTLGESFGIAVNKLTNVFADGISMISEQATDVVSDIASDLNQAEKDVENTLYNYGEELKHEVDQFRQYIADLNIQTVDDDEVHESLKALESESVLSTETTKNEGINNFQKNLQNNLSNSSDLEKAIRESELNNLKEKIEIETKEYENKIVDVDDIDNEYFDFEDEYIFDHRDDKKEQNNLVEEITEDLKEIATVIATDMSSITQNLISFGNEIKDDTTDALREMRHDFSNIAKTINEGIEYFSEQASNTIDSVGNEIKADSGEAFEEMKKDFYKVADGLNRILTEASEV